MNAVFRPRERASLNTSTAHSAVINGSLYDEPTIRAPSRSASETSASGVTSVGMTPALFAVLNVLGARDGAIQQRRTRNLDC